MPSKLSSYFLKETKCMLFNSESRSAHSFEPLCKNSFQQNDYFFEGDSKLLDSSTSSHVDE